MNNASESEVEYADCVCGAHYRLDSVHSCIAYLKYQIDALRIEVNHLKPNATSNAQLLTVHPEGGK